MTKCEVEHNWRRCWRDSCERAQGCAELARCAPFKRPPDPQELAGGHPLDGLHINQGSMDAAADAYEAEYNQAHGIETPNVELTGAARHGQQTKPQETEK